MIRVFRITETLLFYSISYLCRILKMRFDQLIFYLQTLLNI